MKLETELFTEHSNLTSTSLAWTTSTTLLSELRTERPRSHSLLGLSHSMTSESTTQPIIQVTKLSHCYYGQK